VDVTVIKADRRFHSAELTLRRHCEKKHVAGHAERAESRRGGFPDFASLALPETSPRCLGSRRFKGLIRGIPEVDSGSLRRVYSVGILIARYERAPYRTAFSFPFDV